MIGSSGNPSTGSVLFFDNGSKLTTCSSTSTVNADGSVDLNGSGSNANKASCSLSSGLSITGSHTPTAIYNPAAPAALARRPSSGQAPTGPSSTATGLSA